MKAFIKQLTLDSGSFVAQVISEQDYNHGGPAARSHQTKRYPDERLAVDAAREWAEENGFDIYSVDDIAV